MQRYDFLDVAIFYDRTLRATSTYINGNATFSMREISTR